MHFSLTPLWEATAVPAPVLPGPLGGPEDCEVAIVGAGFAGLSTAIHLAERGVAVCVLDAGSVGDGASGRCGGHVLYGGRIDEAELVRCCGEAAGRRLHAFGARAADDTFALIERLGLRCDAVRSGSLYAADTAAGLSAARAKWRALQDAGVPARWLDADAMVATTGSPAFLGGYRNPLAGGVQPLSLVRELARAAAARGVRIHEHSAATALTPVAALRGAGSRGWRLCTARGHLDARRVLVATNGRAGAMWPALEQTVIPVWSFQAATVPLPAGSAVLPGGEVVSDTRRLLDYFRRDAGGRLVMGGKGTLTAPRGEGAFARQRRSIERLFPPLAGVPLAYAWGGQVSVTVQRRPRLYGFEDPAGRLRDDVLASVACNGKGVAWNVALGAALAEALTGTPIDALPLPPLERAQPIPLHALRPFYAAAGAAWYRLLDAVEPARAARAPPAAGAAPTAPGPSR